MKDQSLLEGNEGEKKNYSKAIKELSESPLGDAWNNIICVCRGLMRDDACPVNCNEFFDESLPNQYQPTPASPPPSSILPEGDGWKQELSGYLGYTSFEELNTSERSVAEKMFELLKSK